MVSSSLNLRFPLLSNPTGTPHSSSCYISPEYLTFMMNVHVLACQPDSYTWAAEVCNLSLSLSVQFTPATEVSVKPVSPGHQRDRQQRHGAEDLKPWGESRWDKREHFSDAAMPVISRSELISRLIYGDGSTSWGTGDLMVIVEASWNAVEPSTVSRNRLFIGTF